MKTPEELHIFAQRCIVLFKSKPYGSYEATKHVLGPQAAGLLALDSGSGVAQYLAPRPPQSAPALKSRRSRNIIDPMATSDDEPVEGEASAKRICR